MSRSLRRGLIWSGILAALAVIAVGLWRALPWIVEQVAIRELRSAGIAVTAFTVESISLDRISVAQVGLEDDSLRVADIDIDYSLRNLPDIEIERIVVEGVRLVAVWREGRFEVEPFTGMASGQAGDEPPRIPVMLIGSEMILSDAVMTVTGLPGGPVSVPLSAEIVIESTERVLAAIEAAVETPAAVLPLRANVDLNPETGVISASATLDEGHAATPYGRLSGLAGAATFDTGDGPVPSVELHLSAERVGSPLGSFADAVATASLDGSAVLAALTLPGSDGNSRIALTAKAENWSSDEVSFAVASSVAGFSVAAMPEVPEGPVTFGQRPLAFEATAEGRVRDPAAIDPGNPATWIDRVTANGSLSFDLPDLGVAPVLERVTGHGDLRLSLAGSVLTVATESGVSIATEGLNVSALGFEPPPRIARRLGGEIVFDLAPGPNPLLTLSAERAGPLEALLDNLWRVETADGVTLAGAVRGNATIDPEDGTVMAWKAERAAVSLSGYDDAYLGLTLDQARAVVSGDSRTFEGTWSIAAGGDLALGDQASLDALRIALSGGIAYADSLFRLRLGEESKITSNGGSLGEAVQLDPFVVTAASGEGPLLAVAPSDVGTSLDVRLALLPSEFAGRIVPAPEGEPVPFALSIPRLTLSATAGLPGEGAELRYSGTAGFEEGELEMPTVDVAGREIAAEVAVGPAAVEAVLSIGQLRHTRPPPFVAPLTVKAETRVAGQALTFDVRAGDDSGALVIDLTGSHDLGEDVGEGQLTLYPLRFVADGGLQPATVFPITARHMSATNGVIGADGSISWGPGGIDSDIELSIEDFSTLAGDVAIEDVNGIITFDSLTPPSTLPDQVISVGGVTAGLPLTNGAIVGGFRDGRPYVTETEWKWAGGTVWSTPIRITADGEIEDFTLSLENIGLEALLDLTPEGGNIEATGTLHGQVPMSFRNGGFQVVEGRLETSGPGILRYKSEALSGDFVEGNQGLGLFLQAVENFAYDSIRIDLDGQSGEQIEIALHIDGKNPDLYGGTPFELNLTVTGRLDEIFRKSLETFRIPETLRERIEEMESQ